MTINLTGLISWSTTMSDTGAHTITVRSTDPLGLFVVQTYVLTISNNNQPPVITSSLDTTVFIADNYRKQIYVSDENVSTLVFTKEAGPAGLLISTLGRLVWTYLSVSDTGTYNVSIKVTDQYGLSTIKTFTLKIKYDGRKQITIYPLNPETTCVVGTQYVQNFNAIDLTSSYIVFKAEIWPSWLIFTKFTSSSTFTAKLTGTPTTTGRYQVKLSAMTDTLSYYINVVATPNISPVISSTPVLTTKEDTSYSYQVIASDVDNDPLTYTLISNPSNMTISSTGLIIWNPLQSNIGSHTIVLKVSDSKGASTTQTYILIVSSVNDKPVITSTPTTDAYERLNYSYQIEAYDVDNTVLFYLLSAPQGVTVSSTGEVSWTPTDSQVGNHNISIFVTDSIDTTIQSFVITVHNVNRAPQLSIRSDTLFRFVLNQPLAVNLKAADPDNDSLTYSIDTVGFDMSRVTITMQNSIYLVTPKRIMNDTLYLVVSDGKTQTRYALIIVVQNSTSITNRYLYNATDFLRISNNTIKFGIAKQSNVKIVAYLINGRSITILNGVRTPGSYSLRLDEKLPSGSYICKYTVDNQYTQTNKILIMRNGGRH